MYPCCYLRLTISQIQKAPLIESQLPVVTEEDICPDYHTLPGFETVAPQTWGEHCASQLLFLLVQEETRYVKLELLKHLPEF